MTDSGDEAQLRHIRSHEVSKRGVIACWCAAILLAVAGITATFVVGAGAAPTAMIVFGSLFLVLALMNRVPLSLEVGGAKFDASYEADVAFDRGREVGRQQAVEVALEDVEEAEERGEPAQAALERRRDEWSTELEAWERAILEDTPRWPSNLPATTGRGYRGPTACNAAGITYRQLDYWARTGLVVPSVRSESGSGSQGLYSERDIVLLKVIKRLLDAGVSLQQIRTVILRLRDRDEEDLERVTVMSDGRSLWEATTNDEVIDLLTSGRGMFGIAVGGVLREVREVLGELPGEQPLDPVPAR